MNWISDVIYGLKREYGKPIYLIQDSTSLNIDTGVNTVNSKILRIPSAIFMPVNLRLNFLRSLAIQKGGANEEGVVEVLIDAADVRDKTLLADGNFVIDSKNQKFQIKETHDYDDAWILDVKPMNKKVFINYPVDFLTVTDILNKTFGHQIIETLSTREHIHTALAHQNGQTTLYDVDDPPQLIN